MSAMTLFGNASTLTLPEGFKDATDHLSGGGGTNRRLSLKGNAYREIINGKEVRVSESRTMDVIVINAAPVSRTYYAGSYVEGQTIAPTCWSLDTQSPAPEVSEENRQSPRCLDCKQNIKGSAMQGEGRACRFAQRLAVALEGGNIEDIYQLQLPATSVFGDGTKEKMPMQAYGRFLRAHSTPISTIVTRMKFDMDSPVPKVVFSAVRPLSQDEFNRVVAMQQHPETIKAITLTVSQQDKVEPLFPTEAPKLEAKPQPVEAKVEEPKKVVKKSTPAPVVEASNLNDLVDEWDD